jgi:F-type H+-transporting ATPase subunit gamma
MWGKKGESFAQKREELVEVSYPQVLERPTYGFAMQRMEEFCALYLSKAIDGLYVIYPQYFNAITQKPCLHKLFPLDLDSLPKDIGALNTILEPSGPEMLLSILSTFLANKLYEILLSGSASEHSACMTAMDNATNNAEDVKRKLILEYNRGRQAAITKELIEITSGSEAL